MKDIKYIIEVDDPPLFIKKFKEYENYHLFGTILFEIDWVTSTVKIVERGDGLAIVDNIDRVLDEIGGSYVG